MSFNSRLKLEPRGEKDPKFDPNNKTDRKIVRYIIISIIFLLILIAGFFAIYYIFFFPHN